MYHWFVDSGLTMRTVRKKLVSYLTVALGIILLLLIVLQWFPNTRNEHKTRSGKADVPYLPGRPPHVVPQLPIWQSSKFQRLVHLDLKGAPPCINYLRIVLPLMREMGATGILVEYEDMFPYTGSLSSLARHGSYSRSQVKELQELADENAFSFVPLIQSFGHFEFVLKHAKYKHLRADPKSDKGINPSLNESVALIFEIVDQILDLHPGISYIHIGGDEVYTLGESKETQHRMKEQSMNKNDIYLIHLTSIASHIHEKRPGVRAIFWDDMIRHVPLDTLKKYATGTHLEPMLWGYTPKMEDRFPPEVWSKYAEVFPHIWVASAFKGATGQAQYIVNIDHHLRNHKSWISLLNQHSQMFQSVRGVVLTGWQRSDHHRPLCELLPVGLPSLFVNLQTLVNGEWNEKYWLAVTKALNCDGTLELNISPVNEHYNQCHFPGSEVYHSVHLLHQAIFTLRQTRKATEYYLTKKKIDPRSVQLSHLEALELNITRIQETFQHMHQTLPEVLNQIICLDQEEWLNANIYDHAKSAKELYANVQTIKKLKH